MRKPKQESFPAFHERETIVRRLASNALSRSDALCLCSIKYCEETEQEPSFKQRRGYQISQDISENKLEVVY